MATIASPTTNSIASSTPSRSREDMASPSAKLESYSSPKPAPYSARRTLPCRTDGSIVDGPSSRRPELSIGLEPPSSEAPTSSVHPTLSNHNNNKSLESSQAYTTKPPAVQKNHLHPKGTLSSVSGMPASNITSETPKNLYTNTTVGTTATATSPRIVPSIPSAVSPSSSHRSASSCSQATSVHSAASSSHYRPRGFSSSSHQDGGNHYTTPRKNRIQPRLQAVPEHEDLNVQNDTPVSSGMYGNRQAPSTPPSMNRHLGTSTPYTPGRRTSELMHAGLVTPSRTPSSRKKNRNSWAEGFHEQSLSRFLPDLDDEGSPVGRSGGSEGFGTQCGRHGRRLSDMTGPPPAMSAYAAGASPPHIQPRYRMNSNSSSGIHSAHHSIQSAPNNLSSSKFGDDSILTRAMAAEDLVGQKEEKIAELQSQLIQANLEASTAKTKCERIQQAFIHHVELADQAGQFLKQEQLHAAVSEGMKDKLEDLTERLHSQKEFALSVTEGLPGPASDKATLETLEKSGQKSTDTSPSKNDSVFSSSSPNYSVCPSMMDSGCPRPTLLSSGTTYAYPSPREMYSPTGVMGGDLPPSPSITSAHSLMRKRNVAPLQGKMEVVAEAPGEPKAAVSPILQTLKTIAIVVLALLFLLVSLVIVVSYVDLGGDTVKHRLGRVIWDFQVEDLLHGCFGDVHCRNMARNTRWVPH